MNNSSLWKEGIKEIPTDCLIYKKNEEAAYNPIVRPVIDSKAPVDVAFYALVTQVLEINGKDQYMVSNLELK